MGIRLGEPGVNGLAAVVAALRQWQDDGAPMQLHPGDIGWAWRFGADTTAAAVRTWSLNGQIVAIGLIDTPTLLRLTIAPNLHRHEELARRLVEDVSDPAHGVLPAGRVAVEAPVGAEVLDLLGANGWKADEPWTPLRRELTEPVPDPEIRIEVIEPARAAVRTAVHRAAFDSPSFTEERWHAMASGLPYADARCLVGFDHHDNAVAAVTAWSAGPGRPGLLEPMGVHPDHRGHGHGTAITLAAGATLRKLGASSAMVCTPTANGGGVATYKAAGFEELPRRHDRYREA